jgi:hypothetical protein
MGQMGTSFGREEAIQAVLSRLAEDPDNPWVDLDVDSGYPLVYLEDSIRERPFGWVISFTPKRYLETRNPTYLPIGDLTWVVDRHDGAVHAAGPARSREMLEPGFLNRFLDAYQLECSIRHGRGLERVVAFVQRTLVEAAARYRASWQARNYCSRGWRPLRFPR